MSTDAEEARAVVGSPRMAACTAFMLCAVIISDGVGRAQQVNNNKNKNSNNIIICIIHTRRSVVRKIHYFIILLCIRFFRTDIICHVVSTRKPNPFPIGFPDGRYDVFFLVLSSLVSLHARPTSPSSSRCRLFPTRSRPGKLGDVVLTYLSFSG